MARYLGPKAKLSRREATDLFLKSARRPIGDKAKFDSKPGQHGRTSGTRTSDYGIQLREKQKLRRIYRVLENQFRNYLSEALRRPGVTGENLLQLLETRMDNVIYRLGFAASRAQARQMVTHRHFTVNGHRMNIPSYLLQPGDVIGVHETMTKNEGVKEARSRVLKRSVPGWLDINVQALEGRIVAVPSLEEIKASGDVRDIREQLIIEFYSR